MNDFTNFLFVLLMVSGINYSVLILYFNIGWFRLKVFNFPKDEFTTKVSILIPFRNEENNIENCLEHIIKQDFPLHLIEIILIDDHSNDLSLEKMIKLKEKNPNFNFNIIELNKLQSNICSKKGAIKEGIAFSSGDLIITTDADCIMNKNWLKTIVSYFETFKPKMIVAPVCFIKDNSFFGSLQHLEFLSLQSISAASIGIKHPILSNGANFAYERKAFYEVKGFEGNENIASGDDVFLLHQFYKLFPDAIHYIKSYEAIVFTEPQKKVIDFINQRKRWTSKSKSYNDIFAKYTAISVFLFCISLLFVMLLSFYKEILFWYFCIFYIAKLMIDFPILFQITRFFKKRRLLIWIPFLGFFYPIYVVFIGIYGSFGKYEWKGRKTK